MEEGDQLLSGQLSIICPAFGAEVDMNLFIKIGAGVRRKATSPARDNSCTEG
jgi:hypothetical protein